MKAPQSSNRSSLVLFITGLSVMVLFIWLAGKINNSEDLLLVCGFGISAAIWAIGIIFGFRALKTRDGVAGKRQWHVILGSALNLVFFFGSLLELCAILWLRINIDRWQKKNAQDEAQTVYARTGNAGETQDELLKIAMADFKYEIVEMQKNYQLLGRAISNPHVLEISTIKSIEDLKEREDLVGEFLQSSEKVREFAMNPMKWLDEALSNHQLTAENRKAAREDFLKRTPIANPKIIALREADIRKAKAMQTALGLLKKHWGKWHFVTEKNFLEFSSSEVEQQFAQCMAEAKSSENEMLRLRAEAQEAYQKSTNAPIVK